VLIKSRGFNSNRHLLGLNPLESPIVFAAIDVTFDRESNVTSNYTLFTLASNRTFDNTAGQRAFFVRHND
jgi:hypothetical protein